MGVVSGNYTAPSAPASSQQGGAVVTEATRRDRVVGVSIDDSTENSTDHRAAAGNPGLLLTTDTAGVPAGERVLTVPDVAELLGVIVTRVMDELNQHRLIAVTVDGVRYIPGRFFTEKAEINRFVPGVIVLLADGGWSDQEILDYLFTPDESLPGRPVDALHGHLAREVMRRAQAMAIS